nr:MULTISPECIES: diguanylate cyclase [unclassified Paenibacillus]
MLKEGKKKYIEELGKQIQQLMRLSTELEMEESHDHARRFYRLVHTLKGSAPMFGFTRIGAIAGKLTKHWDWAEQEDGMALLPGMRQHYRACVTASLPLVLELGQEADIYSRELELDEHQERLQHIVSPPQGERLLVIDDDPALRSYLVRRLRLDGYEVDDAADLNTAKRLLRERSYHLVMLDLMMHPNSGYELFEFLKGDPNLKWLPLIVLSGRNEVHDKVRCFYLGADDYVMKPFEYEELRARIYSLLQRTKSFEQMAFRDPLTGVYNRRFFDHQIHVELQRVGRYPAPISLVFIDIDRFKSINDTFGHSVGDLVLQGLAHLLQNNLRSTDLLFRLGGEEFVIVLPNTSGIDALKTMDSILAQIRLEPVAQNEGQSFYITFSAGVCEWEPGVSVEEWIAAADEGMYKAKQNGRNQIVLQSGSSQNDSGAVTPLVHTRKQILIADDDKILRSILVAKLKHLPVEFTEAVDGEEAYQSLLNQPVDLCVLDGIMPRLDGFGMLERLRDCGTWPAQMKVLILSGRNREEEISRGLKLGAHAYLHKPFSMVELEHKVKELLDIH